MYKSPGPTHRSLHRNSKYHPTFINGIKPGGISQVINRLKEMLINEICALRTQNGWQTPSLAL